MNFINEYNINEIFGMRYFVSYCSIKYKIQITEIYQKTRYSRSNNDINDPDNISKYIEMIDKIKEEIRMKLHKFSQSLNEEI